MSPLPLFSDSPRASTLSPTTQPKETPAQQSQVPKSIGGESELANFEKLSALPEDATSSSSHRSVHGNERAVPTSSPVPSQRGLLNARLFYASSEGHDVRRSPAEGSISRNSSPQGVPSESSRLPAPAPNYGPRTNVHIHPLLREAQTSRGIESTMTGFNRPANSSGARLPGAANSPRKHGYEAPPTASAPHSRATSPLRRFGWSPFHRAHEDAFVPVDPFRLRARLHRISVQSPDLENRLQLDATCEDHLFCCTTSSYCGSEGHLPSFLRDVRYFILDTLPRQLYLCILLRLPSLYFSRIARLYEDAQLSKPDLESMIISYSTSRQQEQERIVRSSPIPPGAHYHPAPYLPFPDEWTTANVSPALVRFKQSWEILVDSLLREWKTLNLVSALLLSAIVSMFQTQTMADDPIIRTAALLSLTSALMSLSYGCIYIVRFGTMKSMHKATRWAEEAARTTTFILWNVWVLLAMPVVWLSWSMIFFIVAILAFVWRYGSAADPTSPPLLSPTAAIGTRVAVSTLFLLGFIYLVLIINTLHNYGKTMDEKIFQKMTEVSGVPEIREDDVRSQRGLARATRGRERTRGGHGSDAVDPGVLPAMTGLGLTNIDDVARPSSSEETSEKQQP